MARKATATNQKEAAMPTAINITPTHQDFSNYEEAQARLTAAFEVVCEPGDWRAPIDAVIPPGNSLPLIAEAIIHFTGTVPRFFRVGTTYRVKAAGYREGPCGP